MDKIQQVSRYFRIIFQILFFLAPVPGLFFWYHFLSMPPAQVAQMLNLPVDRIYISVTSVTLGYLADLITTFVWMFGFFQLVKLFKNYEQGKIFTVENAKRYRILAMTIFASIAAKTLSGTLVSIAMTIFHKTKPLFGVIGISSDEIMLVIVGLVTLLIAWIMTEASRIADENAATI